MVFLTKKKKMKQEIGNPMKSKKIERPPFIPLGAPRAQAPGLRSAPHRFLVPRSPRPSPWRARACEPRVTGAPAGVARAVERERTSPDGPCAPRRPPRSWPPSRRRRPRYRSARTRRARGAAAKSVAPCGAAVAAAMPRWRSTAARVLGASAQVRGGPARLGGEQVPTRPIYMTSTATRSAFCGRGRGGGLLIVALKTLKTYKRLAKPPCHRARRGNDFAPRPLVPDSPNHRLLRPTHPPTFRRARAGTSHKCCDCDVYPNLSGCDECGFFDVSCNWAVISADIFPNGVSDAIKGAAIADRPRSEHSAHTGLCHHRPRLTKSASPLSCDR